jgi:nicotinate-nucleotide pyrophosphorylase (carboxylating)
VDYILLDNFSVGQVIAAMDLRTTSGHREAFEVSGSIRLENIVKYAQCGVERISVGQLTHSARAIDVSLNVLT